MKKVSKRLTVSLMILFLGLGILSGCGNKPSGNTEPGNNGSETSETQQGNEKTPAEGQALKDDVIVGISYKQTTLDCQTTITIQHSWITRMVQDTLTHINNDTNTVEPSLAESWDTEENGKIYTFNLRKGVKFHNGEELNASDVIFTINRMNGNSATNNLYNQIESAEALDDYTVKLVMKQPNMDLPFTLSLPYYSIMNEKAVSENEETGTAVGTGPWKLDSYEFGNFTKLVAFDESWRGAPNARTFTFRTIPEASARLIALQNKEVDVCDSPADIEYDLIEDDPKLDLIRFEGTQLTYLAFNTQKAPGNDENFRKACAYAIDVDSIIAMAREGNAAPATTMWGWNQFGFADMGGYPQDLKKAKEYMSKAYPDGVSLEISLLSSHKIMGEVIQDQLKKIGVDVKIREVDLGGWGDMIKNGEFDALTFARGMNVNGDDSRAYLLDGGAASNAARYDRPDLLEIFDKAMAEEDETKRKEYYKQIQEDLHEHAPYVPLYYSRMAIAVKKGTGGIDIYPTTHHDYSYIYVPAE